MPRICIVGNAGSGKSTLSKALGVVLEVPIYHLDRHLLTRSLDKREPDEYTRIHQKLILEENWIIDGNYEKVLRERISRATLVVFLEISRFTTVPRVVRRSFTGGQPADTIPDLAQDRLRWNFLKWVAAYRRDYWRQQLIADCAAAGVPQTQQENGSK